jgi:hypothetical protein
MMTGSAGEVEKAQEDKQDDRRYPKTGERPDRDWTSRPGRSPAPLSACRPPAVTRRGRPHASGPRGFFPAGAAGASDSSWPDSGVRTAVSSSSAAQRARASWPWRTPGSTGRPTASASTMARPTSAAAGSRHRAAPDSGP